MHKYFSLTCFTDYASATDKVDWHVADFSSSEGSLDSILLDIVIPNLPISQDALDTLLKFDSDTKFANSLPMNTPPTVLLTVPSVTSQQVFVHSFGQNGPVPPVPLPYPPTIPPCF